MLGNVKSRVWTSSFFSAFGFGETLRKFKKNNKLPWTLLMVRVAEGMLEEASRSSGLLSPIPTRSSTGGFLSASQSVFLSFSYKKKPHVLE